MMGARYDVVYGERYEQNGEEKTRWTKCGVVLDTKRGGLALKLEMVPIGCSGWFSLMEPKPRGERTDSQRSQDAQRPAGGGDFDDSIPFANYELRGYWV